MSKLVHRMSNASQNLKYVVPLVIFGSVKSVNRPRPFVTQKQTGTDRHATTELIAP